MSIESKLVIAGPCAIEDRDQWSVSIQEAKKRGVILRGGVWKPRTRAGGFEGLGLEGVKLLGEAAREGVTPATEVMTPDHAHAVANEVFRQNPNGRLVIWIGSRNQNHILQREIGTVIKGEPRIQLGIKNPPWDDPDHWKGIASHVASGGADTSQLFMIHRGYYHQNLPHGLRNREDYELAMKVKRETGLRMLWDPSHIGGRKDNVLSIAKRVVADPKVDGTVIEVHPTPDKAQTDASQQVTWKQFDEIFRHNFYDMEAAGK